MFKKLLFHVSLFLFALPAIHAQQLVFKNIGIENGVPATEVYHLFQDSKGYVWVFTEYGIAKHNGTVFKPACTNIPFGESVAYSVTEFEGNLYFLNSKSAIYQISNDSAFRVAGIEAITEEILADNQVSYELFFDNAANLYLSTFYKTYKIPKKDYSIAGGVPIVKHSETGKSNASKNRLHLLKADDPVSVKGYLKLLDHQGEFVRNLPLNEVDMERSAVIQTSKGIYVARGNKVSLTKKNGDSKQYELGAGMICFKQSPDGHFWVGLSYGGLVELDGELNFVEHYFGTVTVSDVLFDDQSGMWVSTIEQGVFYSANTNHVSYSNIPELDECITMLEVMDHKLFIGTAAGKLFVKENERITPVNLIGNTTYITDIIAFDGMYYLATKHSILTISRDLKQVKLFQNLNCYALAKDGEEELVMLSGSAILRKKKVKSDCTKYPTDQKPRSVVKRFDGAFFVSTQKGCFLLKSTLYCPNYLKSLADKNISKLRIDQRNNCWICTKGDGLYCLSPNNKLTRYSNLPSQVINDIVFAENGMVFLSTNKGAFVTYYSKLTISSEWRLILDEEIMRIASYNNNIYIATKTGLTQLNARKLYQETHYRFHLESVVIDGKKMPKGFFRSNYNHNTISFNFDILAYPFPTKKLEYRLRGTESFAGEVSGTQLQLQNLDPGYYTLYVSPKMNMKNAQSQTIRLSFYITPAFWQTTAFVIVLSLVGFCLIAGIGGLIFYRMRKKQERKAAIEKVLTEYRLTALKAQINPHFMSNSLVAIQQLILTEQSDKANLYIAKFSQLIRYLLNYSDQSVSSLTNEISMIDLYVELEQLRFSDKFLFVKHIDPAVNLNEFYIPALITQPLIENAIWHGLLPLPADKQPQLTLSIELKADQLLIRIEDNGVGRLTEPKVEPLTGRKSKGTSLIRNRLDSLNQLYETNGAHIEFTELMDETNTKTGTRVVVLFSTGILKKLAHE
ncbi:MAG: histidine kinase [Fluviicola sp.]|nr:histidine kinase [Fluviicola sp.]